MSGAHWTVIVPVKLLAVAKRRLRGVVPAQWHEALVLAMAQDTVAASVAASGVSEVLVVTADPLVATAASALGARWVPEPPRGDLNAAVRHAAAALDGRPVAALPADLPALRPVELAAALRSAGTEPSPAYVADTAGTGTVLLAAPDGSALGPRFGSDSAAAHARAGARTLDGDWPTLRRDVDTPEDLAVAAQLGLGTHTAAFFGVALR
jgi:2-phospho-L-lactate/phosphoenolpyruvate guanylyltransferase